MKNQRMFLRMLTRGAVVRPGRIAGALAAMVVAATACTAMLNLYTDAGARLQHEFRAYGANIVVAAPQSKPLPQGADERISQALGGRGSAAPFAYAIARTADGQPIVIAGTDFERARKIN